MAGLGPGKRLANTGTERKAAIRLIIIRLFVVLAALGGVSILKLLSVFKSLVSLVFVST